MIDRHRKTGEIVLFLLVMIAETLLLPVVAPVIMVTNLRESADGDLLIPGIQSGGSFVSALIAFVSVGGTVLDSPSEGVDRRSATGLTPEPLPTPIKALTLPSVQKENKKIDLKNETQNHE
ncbi:hypothetical protein Harman_21830 [Haloarcula mannanilytica]|uniref:Uncharacterized protein n=1 Tax=Haloarcula mannanilytica TaxID=2509225 RepID=A0A4C2EIA1_9EURY|nr:hypothetical protein [Haloarcula mannanilytica]GCF14248.1 hypothetical protein Harman_21830 [Haloarcula mannanilytica]